MPNLFLIEGQWWCYLNNIRGDNKVHTFPKGINPKVNVIARLEFRLANYDVAVQHVNQCAVETVLDMIFISKIGFIKAL